MMSHMEQPATNRPTLDYPRTPDGKYKYTAWDGSPRYHKPVTVPGLVGPDFPFPPPVAKFFRKLLRRKDTPAAN
jgi:hypothetical protein